MITLSERMKKQRNGGGEGGASASTVNRISIRDRLLAREVQEMGQLMPATCHIKYENVNDLSSFTLTVRPTEGFWQHGSFKFSVNITEEYNMVPPEVKCLTRLWHPNISETGEVCLSLLRQHSIDGLGWSPTRKLNDVIWGLHALFTDLLNFEDPLNIEAADMYRNSPEEFQNKVAEYLMRYAQD